MAEKNAAPRYKLGQAVIYVDNHGRQQTGEVGRIEASWSRHGREPLIIYSVSHPSYRNKQAYAAEQDILRAAFNPNDTDG